MREFLTEFLTFFAMYVVGYVSCLIFTERKR